MIAVALAFLRRNWKPLVIAAAIGFLAMSNWMLRAELATRTAELTAEQLNHLATVANHKAATAEARVAIETRRMEASRQITDAVLSRMAPGDRADSTLAAVELLKFRIMSLVMDEDTPDPKFLGAAALALSRLSSTSLREAEGQRLDRKDQVETEERQRAAEAEQATRDAANAAVTIAREAGLSADRIAAIKRGVLGLSA